MARSAFFKLIDQNGVTVPGESFHANYNRKDGWSELGDWGWDIETDVKHTGTGLAVGRAKQGNLTFSHSFDKSSPLMLAYMIQGMSFQSMQIDMLKQTGADTPEAYFRITAGSVFITKLTNKSDEEGKITQEVEAVCKEINIQYKKQKPNGSLTNEGCLIFMWNMAEQTFKNSADLVVASL